MSDFRKSLKVTVALATAWGCMPTQAFAACAAASAGGGSGPPSISATEVSTAQALQFLRKRQDDAQNAPVQTASNAPAPQAAPAAPKPVAQALPAPKAAAPAPKTVAEAKPAPPPVPKAVPAQPAAPKAVADAKPVEPAKPADVAKPVTPEAAKPADAPKPGDTTKPATADATKPADTTKPAAPDAAKPAEAKPAPDAAKPAMADAKPAPKPEMQKPDVQKPSVAEAMKPSTEKAPKAMAKAELTARPAPAAKVSMAAKPGKSIVAVEKTGPVRERAPVRYVPSLKDSPEVYAAPEPTHGAFAQAYYDHERHTGWTLDGSSRGGLTSKSDTAGFITGTDWVAGTSGTSKVLLGVLGGASRTGTDYNDGQYVDSTGNTYQRTAATETVTGGGGGIYALLVNDRFSANALFMVDGYTTEQSDTIQQIGGCGAMQPQVARQGIVDSTSYTVMANASYRYLLGSENTWLEPTVGVRYNHVDYGTNKGTLALGYVNGDAFRVQGGARLGHLYDLGANGVVVTTLAGILYSDVSISGFTAPQLDGFNNARIDEGKLRVLGQLTTALSKPNGLTYLLQGEVRGGDQVIGYGAKVGFRYEW